MADANISSRSRDVPIVFDSLKPVRKRLTAERLRELLNYDPDTGVFTWRVVKNSAKPGDKTGYVRGFGYRMMKLDGIAYLAHRLAWLHVHGVWPEIIDHINGDPADNRLCNLRDVSHQVNMQNKRKPCGGTASGLLGVHANFGAWVARIGHNGRAIHIGRFKTKEEAHIAYLEAKRRLHEGCTI